MICYSKATDAELWRVVVEGLHKRLKVYPDGRQERFDGKDNFPKYQPATEVLRLGPSKDRGEIDAAVTVFKRFAAESVSPSVLAHFLNSLGYRTAQGNPFQGHHITAMLEDPIYIGYYAWNKRHFGKFHRWTNGQAVLELNYEEKQSRNDRADWVESHRLFEPLVDRPTWDAVQKKLDRPKRASAPRSAALYLAGLVYCGNCGMRMIAGRGRSYKDSDQPLRFEFICGGYHRAVRYKKREGNTCLRNSVFQHELEQYVNRYLEETGKRLELLTEGLDAGTLTGKLEGQLESAHSSYVDNYLRMLDYIRDNDPDGWAAMWEGIPEAQEVSVERAVEHYRRCFDPERPAAEIARLEAEHTACCRRYAELPTPRAKEKAKAELVELEARIAELEKQQQDLGATVAAQWHQVLDLANSIREARAAMVSEAGERALRQRAEALRAVIHRIECTFTATGRTKGGRGRKNTRLAKVTIYPVVGDAHYFLVEASNNVLRATRATSHM